LGDLMKDKEVVSVTYKNYIADIVIHREESLNALDSIVLQALGNTLNTIRLSCNGEQAYQSTRVVTIRGEGDRAFVAGADIKLMKEASRHELNQFIALGQRVMRDIELLPLPVIAVVDGFAIGGGLELALACDCIIATEKAKVGQAEVNLGLIPGFGGTQRLVHRVGTGTAKRLIFSGETVNADEGYRLGLFDWLTTTEELEDKLKTIIDKFAACAPLAIAASKRCVERAIETNKLAGLSKEMEEFALLFDSEDTKEGLAAFTEKRKPRFIGK
jgi:enoyl-CoA hydratase